MGESNSIIPYGKIQSVEQSRDFAVAVKTRFEHSTENELEYYLENLSSSWIIPDNKNPDEIIKNALTQFHLSDSNFSYESVRAAADNTIFNIVHLHRKFILLDLIGEEQSKNYITFSKIFETVHYVTKILEMSAKVINCHSKDMNIIQDSLGLLQYQEIDINKNTSFQNLILYLMDEVYNSDYRRYQTSLYRKVLTKDGQFTHAWEEATTIKNFIYDRCQQAKGYQNWHNLTANPSNGNNAEHYLSMCRDPRIQDLKKDRHVFAFSNGVWVCKEWDSEYECYNEHFYEYGSDEVLDQNVVACKYFDMEFNSYDDVEDFYDIPTPFLQDIFDYQGFDAEVCRWIYTFLGRLLFDLGELDNWQVALFLKGVAGCGKSTICKLVAKFYEACDVGILSNNIEHKFGLTCIKDTFLWTAPEIKGSLGLEQSEFQLMIEGGDMQLAEKHKPSTTVHWKAPGLFGGNEPPEYTDNSGSISRRLVIVKFNRAVSETKLDPDLDNKLFSELPNIMKKTGLAYLSAIREYNRQGIWKCLPKYFKDTKAEMAESSNSLQHFLNSGKLKFGSECYILQTDFTNALNQHCKECSLKSAPWKSDYYTGIFGQFGLVVLKNVRKRWPNIDGARRVHGNFIEGIDLIDSIGEVDENDEL